MFDKKKLFNTLRVVFWHSEQLWSFEAYCRISSESLPGDNLPLFQYFFLKFISRIKCFSSEFKLLLHSIHPQFSWDSGSEGTICSIYCIHPYLSRTFPLWALFDKIKGVCCTLDHFFCKIFIFQTLILPKHNYPLYFVANQVSLSFRLFDFYEPRGEISSQNYFKEKIFKLQ